MNNKQIIDSIHLLFLLCINTFLIVTSTNDNLILLIMFPFMSLLTGLIMIADPDGIDLPWDDYEKWYYYFVTLGKYGTLFVLILRIISSSHF